MGFSTNSVLAHTWRFDDIEPEVVAEMLRCSLAEAKARLAATRMELADPARCKELLLRLPVPALAVLCLLAEHDGMLAEDELHVEMNERFGFDAHETLVGVSALFTRVIVVALRGRVRGVELALVENAVDAVLDRVADLDVPELAAGAVPSTSDDSGARALIAACMALGHNDLKLTQAGLPHRAALKRLAKQLGCTEDALERDILEGCACGLLDEDDDGALRPELVRLRDAATGRYACFPEVAMVAERLRTSGPLPRGIIERWLRRTRVHDRRAPETVELERWPGFAAGTLGDVKVIAARSLDGAAAASITPSFEVFLPPESRLVDLVDVLACAELVRIDRVIVARITKASICRAVARGADGSALLAQLAQACRTAIPQNVEIAVRDWSAGVTYATLTTGQVVAVSPSDEPRVLAALQAWNPRSVAPGVLVLPLELPTRAITAALAKIGVHERAATSPASGTDVQPTALPALRIGGDPQLRARVTAYRRGDEHERSLVPPPAASVARGTGRPPRSASPPGSATSGPNAAPDRAPSGARRPLDNPAERALTVDAGAASAVDGWAFARRCRISNTLFCATALALDAVSDDDASFLLAATSAQDLHRRLVRLLLRGGFHAIVAKHRDDAVSVRALLAELGVSSDDGDAIAARSSTSAPPHAEGAAIEWHRSDLLPRLQAAARTHSTMLLDVGTRTARVAISRVLQRGSVWMVLGEDGDDDALSAVAFPLDAIKAIADLPAGAASATAQLPDAAQGLPGHVLCPCGSGRRYRNCCRKRN